MDNSNTICIIAPGYIASTPRVVKEADALSQAGFKVRVVCSQGDLAQVRDHDRDLLRDKAWQYQAVRWSTSNREENFLYHLSRYRYHITRRLPSRLWKFWRFAEIGEGRIYPELARLA